MFWPNGKRPPETPIENFTSGLEGNGNVEERKVNRKQN